jgi:hypothetical protein
MGVTASLSSVAERTPFRIDIAVAEPLRRRLSIQRVHTNSNCPAMPLKLGTVRRNGAGVPKGGDLHTVYKSTRFIQQKLNKAVPNLLWQIRPSSSTGTRLAIPSAAREAAAVS